MNIREAYAQLLDRELPDQMGSNPNVSTKCFCHDDQHNSCSVTVDTGGRYCHATGNKGYFVHAVMRVKGIEYAEAQKTVKDWKVEETPSAAPREKKELPPIDARVRDGYIRTLNSNVVQREYAQKKLGWNPDTLKKFGIGWSEETKLYTVPINDEAGNKEGEQ